MGGLDKYISLEYIRNNNIGEVENINLGIQRREDVDLALGTDLKSVKVHINKADHLYKYSDVIKDDKNEDTSKYMDPKVKFGRLSSQTYSRALYASDIKYERRR